MTIQIKIPKEFEEHFNKDRFIDSLSRLYTDIDCFNTHFLISGLYEKELLMMLRNSFCTAKIIEE